MTASTALQRLGIPMALFGVATLLPAGLLAGGLSGVVWAGAGLAYMAVFVALMDQIVPKSPPAAPDEAAEFPAGDGLLVAIGAVHLALLPAAAAVIGTHGHLTPAARAALLLGLGLWIGQVAVPAAHELIHRSDRRLFRLGVTIYISILFGHHASAHRLVHHRHVASPADPNTARAGEGFYRFAGRAWTGSFREGWRAESARPGRRGHPYAVHLAGAAAALLLAFALAGWTGVAAWVVLSLHAQAQLLLADYVQHYGLQRRTGPDGRLQPVGTRHSWNAPHRASGAMMLHAPRHSDHHAHPARAFPALRLPDAGEAPRLPVPLPVACTIALVPPLWRRMMHPRLAKWQD